MNGMNLIQLEKKKCEALFSKQLLIYVFASLLGLPLSRLVNRRCRQDVNIYVLALLQEQGRRLHLSWDLNYSYLFFNDFNFIVNIAVVVALPSCSVRSLLVKMKGRLPKELVMY